MSLTGLLVAASTAASTPVFIEARCADARLASIGRCGSVEVAENREKPGRAIRLNVVILRASSPTPDLPPLFEIEGGPGLPATKNADFYLTDGAAYRARRDIVLLDQRGTGASNPLNCPELDRSETGYAAMFPRAAVVRCRESLATSADLTRYGTREAVADLDAVRAALGHTKIDIFAMSYGTTVALRYLATHPDRVRAAVLMGVVPAIAMTPQHHAVAAERAIKLLFADCTADAACRAAFSDPNAAFDRALKRLAKNGQIPPEIFAERTRAMMYSALGARRIPMIIHHAAKGNLEPFRNATRPGQRMPYSNGAFLSVTCTESFALMNYRRAAAAARKTRFGDYRLRRQRAACAQWRAGKVDAGHLAPVSAQNPVLLISGRLDPVTPPEWAEAAARTLPRARHLIIREGGHIPDGLTGLDTCFDPVILRFFETGDAKTLDASCFAEMRAPAFAVAEKP